MGRALLCPLCRKPDISIEEVRYVHDLWSCVPMLDIEVMLALVCKNCRHVQLIHLQALRSDELRLSLN